MVSEVIGQQHAQDQHVHTVAWRGTDEALPQLRGLPVRAALFKKMLTSNGPTGHPTMAKMPLLANIARQPRRNQISVEPGKGFDRAKKASHTHLSNNALGIAAPLGAALCAGDLFDPVPSSHAPPTHYIEPEVFSTHLPRVQLQYLGLHEKDCDAGSTLHRKICSTIDWSFIVFHLICVLCGLHQ